MGLLRRQSARMERPLAAGSLTAEVPAAGLAGLLDEVSAVAEAVAVVEVAEDSHHGGKCSENK